MTVLQTRLFGRNFRRGRAPALYAPALATMLVVTGVTSWANASDDETPSASGEQQAQAGPENPVRVVALGEIFRGIDRSAPAHALSLNKARIAAEISARIVKIDVETGDTVNAGQSLVTLDCSDYERARTEASARLDVSQSRLRLAEQQLDRARRLVQSNSMSDDALDRNQAEYDSAQAEISAQRAMVARADNQASRCLVKAPFAGVISQRMGQVGEFTAPGSVLLEVTDIANVELSVQLPEAQAQDPSRFADSVFVYGSVSYPVILRTILPLIDEVTRSREARFRFVSQPALVGSVGRLQWRESATAIPAEFISQRDGQFGVMIADGTIASFVPIEGAREGRPAIVELDPATAVITEGRHGLADGDPITIQQ